MRQEDDHLEAVTKARNAVANALTPEVAKKLGIDIGDPKTATVLNLITTGAVMQRGTPSGGSLLFSSGGADIDYRGIPTLIWLMRSIAFNLLFMLYDCTNPSFERGKSAKSLAR